jgi:hypothetical protein
VKKDKKYRKITEEKDFFLSTRDGEFGEASQG